MMGAYNTMKQIMLWFIIWLLAYQYCIAYGMADWNLNDDAHIFASRCDFICGSFPIEVPDLEKATLSKMIHIS